MEHVEIKDPKTGASFIYQDTGAGQPRMEFKGFKQTDEVLSTIREFFGSLSQITFTALPAQKPTPSAVLSPKLASSVTVCGKKPGYEDEDTRQILDVLFHEGQTLEALKEAINADPKKLFSDSELEQSSGWAGTAGNLSSAAQTRLKLLLGSITI